MLFHNRPVKAAMGSVIVNGGVQLIGGKSLDKSKLATLHLGRVKMNLQTVIFHFQGKVKVVAFR